MVQFSMLDCIDSAILVVNPDGSIIYANTACVNKLGIAREPTEDTLSSHFGYTSSLTTDTRINLKHGDIHFNATVQLFRNEDANHFVITIGEPSPFIALESEFNKLEDALTRGSLEIRLDNKGLSNEASSIIRQVNTAIKELRQLVLPLIDLMSSISECDLRVSIEPQMDNGEISALYTKLSTTVSNLTESIRQTTDSSARIAVTTNNIVQQNDQLADRTSEQTDAIRITSANMHDLSQSVSETSDNAMKAYQKGQETISIANDGRTAMEAVVQSMDEIEQSADRVSEIIKLINTIAFQTNILALNAAVEAAHAGEHGRGFSIVAAEVRNLANRSKDASDQIKSLIEESVKNTQQGKKLVAEADNKMRDILHGVTASGNQARKISEATKAQHEGIEEANSAIQRIEQITEQNNELVSALANNTSELDRQANYLKDASEVFFITETELSHPLHKEARRQAEAAASQVGVTFAQLIEAGRITRDALFDFRYAEIPNTNPIKHSTAYDQLCDEFLPSIQEQILNDYPDFVYAITADCNGYVPTHNDQFCQPLTGDPEKDLVGNRTKRIFNDRVGKIVGSHTEPFKLQTYRRDTSELMFDLSVPVYVQNEHWGGFRIGYRIQ